MDIALTPYLSAVAAEFISSVFTGNAPTVSIDYFRSFTTFYEMPNVAFFLAMQLAVFVFAVYLYVLLPMKSDIKDIKTMKITEDIYIPVPAGNGQFGSERFATEAEKKRQFGIFVYTGKEKWTEETVGLVVEMTVDKRGREIILFNKSSPHTLIVGITGCGKTRRILLETMWLQFMAGVSVIASDVKGELYYYTARFAESMGYLTLAFDLRTPEKGVHYNYLQPILDSLAEKDTPKAIDKTWDLVSCLVAESKGEALWYNGECATIAAAILIVAIDAPKEFRNLTNVYYFLAFMCQPDAEGNMPVNDYLRELPDTHPAKGVFAMATIAADKTRSSFFSSALGTLRLFTNPRVAEMTSKSDFRLEDVFTGKVFLSMMIPDEKKTLYPLVSLLVTQLYQAQVDIANRHGGCVPVEGHYDLDELGNFPFIPTLQSMFSAGRSRGCHVNGIIQDFQQLESKYKDDWRTIKSNAELKMYLRSDDENTLESFSKLIGKYTVESPGASTSASNGKQESNYSSNSSLTGRELLMPAEIGRIKYPYGLCKITGEYPSITNLPDLSNYRANKILGLGDKKHNQRLIERLENERAARPLRELNLWGIWNQYSYDEIDYDDEEEYEEPVIKRKSFLDIG